MKTLAILITCHNRKNKTLSCLESLFEASIPKGYALHVYLVDDGSTDGTAEAVANKFPEVNIIQGSGNLFWAGGMRLAWRNALKGNYDAFLLINDDVVLRSDFLESLVYTEKYSYQTTGRKGIYSGATVDGKTQKTTYGGAKIRTNHFIVRLENLNPTGQPQPCEITNANILWVDKEVVDKIGIFDDRFTHGIADYDYSLQAIKKNIPVFLAPGICGVCTDDHGNNWKPSDIALKDRITYLRSPKGLAYKEYLYYIKKHFPLSLPYSFIMLWMKTLFPVIWEKFKK